VDPETKVTEALTREGDDHFLVQQFTLRAIAGPASGSAYVAHKERIAVGTHPSNDLALEDPTLSRFHCEIAIRDGRAMIRDLDSRNGTLVDGVAIESAYLREGSVLTLGRTQLRIEVGARSVKIALSQREAFGVLVGRSPAIRAVFAKLEQAAASSVSVLLQGETGTGKDAAAESLHLESARRDGPFVTVDCGALPASLLASELFGHVRGAFTGADADRTGAFEAASGGTLFLDELGELDITLQPNLLRAVGKREIHRIGSNTRHPVDIRLVTATNRNLRREVNANRFREDLLYRVAVFEVTMPPLRERLVDLPLLIEAMLGELGMLADPAAELLRSRDVLLQLERHSWPGNVRELRNYVERCLALARFTPVESAPVDSVDPSRELALPLSAARDRWLRRYLQDKLSRFPNVTAAARAAGIGRSQFYRLMSQVGLR
jgi:DNA-binding NtrC family response regulator